MTKVLSDLPWLPEKTADWAKHCRSISASPATAGSDLKALAGYRLNAMDSLKFRRALDKAIASGADLAPLARFDLRVLSSYTFDLIADCLPAAAARHGVGLSVSQAPYDQITQEALDPSSQTLTSACDAVLIAADHRWFGLDKPSLDAPAKQTLERAVDQLELVIESLRHKHGKQVIVQTVPVPNTPLFGNFDRRVAGAKRSLICALNDKIADICAQHSLYLFDVAALAETVGLERWFNEQQWMAYKLPFDMSFAPLYADWLGRLLGAVRGKSHKCLVLDLDNTIWGGVIGDDGLDGISVGEGSALGEAHLAVQKTALELKDRGILLAVSSKNDDENARLPFRKHPDMALRESDISVFMANWHDKASNLEAIAKQLNIGLDALVFLDDNPAERAQMRAALPMVAVPELPDDPGLFASTLMAAGYFEAISFSSEDRLRGEAVAADAKRVAVKASARDLGDYLSSLEMKASAAEFDPNSIGRTVQLINKTNQFNLTTKRYTDAEVKTMAADPQTYTLQLRLRDRFSDLGMICVVICRQSTPLIWDIDSWLMSCRVLGRGVEKTALCQIVQAARAKGVTELIGRYVATPKNKMVADHYEKLGFALQSQDDGGTSVWRLDLETFTDPKLDMMLVDQAAKPEQDDPPPAEPKPLPNLGLDTPVKRRTPGRTLNSGQIRNRLNAVLDGSVPMSQVEFLLRDPNICRDLRNAPLVAKILLANGRFEQFISTVDSIVKQGIRPTHGKFFSRSSMENRLGPEIAKQISRMNYSGSIAPETAADLFEIYQQVNDLKPPVSPVLGALFSIRKDKDIDKETWDANASRAQFLVQAMGDLDLSHPALAAGVDGNRAAVLIEEIRNEKQVLFVTFHCGFIEMLLAFIHETFDNVLFIGRGIPGADRARAGKLALFPAYKALASGRPVLIAPDGGGGQDRSTINILGVEKDVAKGAAALAYDTRTPVYWSIMRVDENGFYPEFIKGPTREENESNKEFIERLNRFYEERLNSYFTEDAHNITGAAGKYLRSFWDLHSNAGSIPRS